MAIYKWRYIPITLSTPWMILLCKLISPTKWGTLYSEHLSFWLPGCVLSFKYAAHYQYWLHLYVIKFFLCLTAFGHNIDNNMDVSWFLLKSLMTESMVKPSVLPLYLSYKVMTYIHIVIIKCVPHSLLL